MSAILTALSRDALDLAPDARFQLARQLLDSVDLEPEPGAEAAWEVEIGRRITRYNAGETRGIPADEVFERLRQIAPAR